MPRILDSYIFKELGAPFIISSGVLSVTLLLSKMLKLVELVVNHGVGITIILKFLFFLMPSFLIYVIPLSFLLSVLIAFNRLSGDSEITAIKTAGINLYRLTRPVVVMAAIAFLLSLYLTLFAFPWANLSAKKLLYDVARTKISTGIKEKTFNDTFDGIVLYADHIAAGEDTLNGVMVSEEKQDEMSNVITANNGVFIVDPESMTVTLRLQNGTLHKTGKQSDKYTHMTFSTYDINLRLKQADIKNPDKNRSNRELTVMELAKKINEVKKAGKNPSPYIIDMHKRAALPAAVFVFGLLGVPLAIQHVRTSRYRGFIIALVVMLLYYVLSTAFESFGESGKINPIFAVWGSNIIMGICGLYVFYKTSRESPIKSLNWPVEFISGIIDALKRIFSKQ